MSINKQNAEEDLRLYKKYNEPMQKTELSNAVKDAERQLTNAKEKAEINLAERRALVTRKERQVNSTKTERDKLDEQLGFMTITAPGPGVIHYGDPARPWMRENVKVGNSFHRGNTLFTLPDLREMQVLVQVHEADIDMLDEDMDVIVTVEASKGNLFPAKVTHIATVATSDWSDDANKTFRVEITMEPIEIKLRAGITATTEILCEEIADVLIAPIHTVFVEDGEKFCFVLNGTEIQRRQVETGKNNAHYVVIADGLSEGDKVLLFDPREAGMVESKRAKGDADADSPLVAESLTALKGE
jgi:RND family efflux transporter MFP subunit